jgi:hypothetical protein
LSGYSSRAWFCTIKPSKIHLNKLREGKKLECNVCSKETSETFLCKDCCNQGLEYIESNKQIIENADWRYHCMICGEFEDRLIVNFPEGPICNRCINEAFERYKSSK